MSPVLGPASTRVLDNAPRLSVPERDTPFRSAVRRVHIPTRVSPHCGGARPTAGVECVCLPPPSKPVRSCACGCRVAAIVHWHVRTVPPGPSPSLCDPHYSFSTYLFLRSRAESYDGATDPSPRIAGTERLGVPSASEIVRIGVDNNCTTNDREPTLWIERYAAHHKLPLRHTTSRIDIPQVPGVTLGVVGTAVGLALRVKMRTGALAALREIAIFVYVKAVQPVGETSQAIAYFHLVAPDGAKPDDPLDIGIPQHGNGRADAGAVFAVAPRSCHLSTRRR